MFEGRVHEKRSKEQCQMYVQKKPETRKFAIFVITISMYQFHSFTIKDTMLQPSCFNTMDLSELIWVFLGINSFDQIQHPWSVSLNPYWTIFVGGGPNGKWQSGPSGPSMGRPCVKKCLFKWKSAVRGGGGGGLKTHSKWNVLQWIITKALNLHHIWSLSIIISIRIPSKNKVWP